MNRHPKADDTAKSKVGSDEAPDNKSALDLDPVFQQNDALPRDTTSTREAQHYARSRRHTTRSRQQPRPEYQAFAEKLSAIMAKLGLSPSEVARRTWGSHTDKRGYSVARNRDRIGHYLAGTSYPGEINLKKLADVLGVPVETLAIERPTDSAQSGAGRAHGPAQARPGHSPATGLVHTTLPLAMTGLARFQCDRMISSELAVTLQQMILDDDRKRAAAAEAGNGGNGNGNGNGNGDTPPRVGSVVGGRGEGD
jgi:transcriptional regulator with XRE-family HTH domain